MKIVSVKRIQGGYIEAIDIEPYGVVRVNGWCEGGPPRCALDINGRTVLPDAVYRVPRPDVAAALNSDDNFIGFMVEFFNARPPEKFLLQLEDEGTELELAQLIVPTSSDTAYSDLISTSRVYHRADIYGSGPPTGHVHEHILNLALLLPPPILDFGCGCGALVRELRHRGIEAYGIEIDREPIRRTLIGSVEPFVTLYDGKLPLPYKSRQFMSVISSEVIEHIENYEQALEEIARVTSHGFGITVPDMSAIPIGSVHGVCPFHLLESTHVNFFSYNSLYCILSKWYQRIQFYRLAPGLLNGSFLPGSLGAIAQK